MISKGPDAFRTISEAAEEVGAAPHVLRFWETRFSFIRPVRRGGGQRFYRPRDIELLAAVRRRLHEDGYSIREVQRLSRAALLASGKGGLPISTEKPATRLSPDTEQRLRVALTHAMVAKTQLDLLLQT